MTFEEYVSNYEKYGKTINQVQSPKNPLNEKQLRRLYNKYYEQYFKEVIFQRDEKLDEVYSIVDRRDNYECQLIRKLSLSDLYIENLHTLLNNAPVFLTQTIDHAHVYGKGAFSFMKYDPDNIILLNRYSHSLIDQYRNPITGFPIDQEERIAWWIFIIGKERYEKLESTAKNWGNSDNG